MNFFYLVANVSIFTIGVVKQLTRPQLSLLIKIITQHITWLTFECAFECSLAMTGVVHGISTAELVPACDHVFTRWRVQEISGNPWRRIVAGTWTGFRRPAGGVGKWEEGVSMMAGISPPTAGWKWRQNDEVQLVLWFDEVDLQNN